MPGTSYGRGEVLLAMLVFSSGRGAKRRPVLVVHDFGDDDLLVVPVTSHPPRAENDVPLAEWQAAGLKLASSVRAEKLGTIEKTCVVRTVGALTPSDFSRVKEALARVSAKLLW